ncbi:hypothetical protein lerEdw1_004658 [Lerista edwardsae]|nr:hypothetical protein lerEdw1_004658 [Lerista edwardsae]
MKEMKQRRKKERTWAEAARLVLENYSDGPMTPKQILQVIETEGLKEMSGTSPLACLNAMLHSNSRGCDGLFYKLPGRISLFTLKKDAVQWSRNLSAPEGEELDDAADAESSGSNEASTVSGDNDVSLDDTSSNASCSTEPQSRSVPAVRESHRAAAQASKQKKKTGMMLPRVVLTPLKVNGAHMETSSGQMKRNRGDDIDFETPGSILVNTNLRALINSRTFNVLPLHFQQQLLHLLPEVDRQTGTDGLLRLSGSALNNEFFTHAAQSWRERLADGEFTHEMQVRIRQEMEKEKKMEQWKERFFEDYYGQKLGLAREEPPPENSLRDDVENRTSSPAPEEPAQLHRGPVTRQRDGHFRKRALRCRTRKSLHKLGEPEPAEAAQEVLPVESASPEGREAKPDVGPSKGSQAPPEPEALSEAAGPPSRAGDGGAVAGRMPSAPQEPPHDQESKEQKRKCLEQAASASFPEKKPRLEDRQSFRNTIESVHPEKPQPTKEEPKVPPIRIQLSRIKPPWVAKGQPAYQICPRIIPNTERSSQDRTRTSTTADFEACSLQGRVQREAVAPATAIGGGGGPGGGRTTDEGGGGGGGGGDQDQQPSGRPKCWRSKRAHGKCLSNLQRAQLLPPSHLGGEPGFGLAQLNSSPRGREASPPRAEGDLALGQATSSASREAEGASGSPRAGAGLAKLPLSSVTTEKPEGSSGHLPHGGTSEPSPKAASLERCGKEARGDLPPDRQRRSSWLEEPPVHLLGDSSRVGRRAGESPLLLNGGSARTLGRTPGLGLESKMLDWEQEGPDVPGPCAGQPPPAPRNACTAGKADLSPQWHGQEDPAGLPCAPQEEASLAEPVSPPAGSNASRSPPSAWEMLLGAGTEAALRRSSPTSDAETRSTVSGTTESASDLEVELTDDSRELEQECGQVAAREAAPSRSRVETYNGIPPERLIRAGLPSEAGASGQRQPWKLPPSLPQKASESAPDVGVASQKSPLLGTPTPLASAEVSSPPAMQLLKGGLPTQAVLPGTGGGPEEEAADLSLGQPSTEGAPFPVRGKGSGFRAQEAPQAGVRSTIRNGYCVPRSLRDSLEGQLAPGPVPSPAERLGQELESQERSQPTLKLGSGSADQTVGPSQKPEALALSGGLHSSPTAPVVPAKTTVAEPVPCGSHEEKLKPSPAPPFLSPSRTALHADPRSGEPAQRSQEAPGKKVFGPSALCGAAARAQPPRTLAPSPILGMLSHSRPAPKSPAPGGGAPVPREGGSAKQRGHGGGGGGVENKAAAACPGPGKRSLEKRLGGVGSPADLAEQLQSLPLLRDLPFLRLPREPRKGLAQPLEPSSIPSQLNIKQAFYGKLSRLQLSPASLHYAPNASALPRSLAGSVIQLSRKAGFAGPRGVSLSAQMFAGSSSMEELSLKCSCSLKAMIVCRGCGAFCHDDCIGPSKLCVLCLVVR